MLGSFHFNSFFSETRAVKVKLCPSKVLFIIPYNSHEKLKEETTRDTIFFRLSDMESEVKSEDTKASLRAISKYVNQSFLSTEN